MEIYFLARILESRYISLQGSLSGDIFSSKGSVARRLLRIPVNVSGGLLSKGHPLGATGIANIYEVCTHLRGEAGERQVENAKIGMTHVIGLGSACGIHILEKV